jgi:YnbE-like lipoprotein
MAMTLTRRVSDARQAGMKRFASLIAVGLFGGLAGCVNVQAPDKPIEINLNVNIRQEVIVKLQKDADDFITSNPELFPK